MQKAAATMDETEIKISTGIKISAKRQLAKDADMNLYHSGFMNKPQDKIIVKARLTDNFKKKINAMMHSNL